MIYDFEGSGCVQLDRIYSKNKDNDTMYKPNDKCTCTDWVMWKDLLLVHMEMILIEFLFLFKVDIHVDDKTDPHL